MVRLQPYLRLVCLCGLVLAAQSVVAAVLQVKAERHRLELGQPIWLTLISDQTAVSLETLDFSAWRQQVVFPRAYHVNLANQGHRQVLRLRVYPLHKGPLTLAGLQFLQHTTPALHFTVTPARDPGTGTPMQFSWQISSRQPWQQQQVVVRCQLSLPTRYALFTQADTGLSGSKLLPMQIQKQAVTSAKHELTRYTLGWVVLPARAGKLQLQLPAIQYVRDGVVVRRFYVPPQTLRVRALPSWLPGTIPVGKVNVRRFRLSTPWLSTGVLSQLHLQLQVQGVASDLIPDYAGQLRSDRQLRFYSPQRHVDTRVASTGLQHELHDTIPLVAKHIGIIRLPGLRLQYFDPDSGTLKTRQVQGQTVVIINTWLKWLLLLLIAWLLVWLGRKVLHFLLRSWRRFRTYQQALAQLAQADSLAGIRQAMYTMAQAEGWQGNLSYLQWQARMHAKTALADKLAVAQLNAAAYGGGELNMAETRASLNRICRQRRLAFS